MFLTSILPKYPFLVSVLVYDEVKAFVECRRNLFQKIVILLRNCEFCQPFRVVLFQIHFGFEAARIRNDFFRILNRIRPDPDPQHCNYRNIYYFFPLADFCAAYPGGWWGRFRQYRRQERFSNLRDHNQRHPVRRHLRHHVSNVFPI
jgi:hypothetical protein